MSGSPAPGVALVTGASGGIGGAVARGLAAAGWAVVGTSRSAGAGLSEQPAPGRVVTTGLDVTDDASVAAAVAAVVEGAGRLDLVVNNAGTTLIGALEEVSAQEALALLQTNLLGAHRVTRAALPHLRAVHGRVIVIGSIAEFLPKLYEGFYSVSKAAVATWAEVLRYEVEPFGVRVSVVEPGFVRTGMGGSIPQTAARLPEYATPHAAAAKALAEDIAGGIDPAEVGEVVVRLAGQDDPHLRTLVGADAKRLRLIRTLLPDALFARGLRSRFPTS